MKMVFAGGLGELSLDPGSAGQELQRQKPGVLAGCPAAEALPAIRKSRVSHRLGLSALVMLSVREKSDVISVAAVLPRVSFQALKPYRPRVDTIFITSD